MHLMTKISSCFCC